MGLRKIHFPSIRPTGKREHGKTVFADLRDGTGSIQLYLGKKMLSDRDWSVLNLLDLGDIVLTNCR